MRGAPVLCLLALFLAFSGVLAASALAVPECYRNAAAPAHELGFLEPGQASAVTALTPDGQGCVEVPLYRGEPLLRQKLYAPFRQVYEAYVKAREKGNRAAAVRTYTYVRPSPRPFPLWVWLANAPEGAPMPWGMDMTLQILRMLQTDKSMEKDLLARGDNDLPVLDMQRTWPVLYLLMGGEVWPQENGEEWTATALSPRALNRLLLWRYPWASIESRKQNRETEVRLK